MEHLGRFGAPPVDWKPKIRNQTPTVEDLMPNEMSTEQEEKLVVLLTLFPNKDRDVLQSKVKEFDGDGQRMELWIQEQLDGDDGGQMEVNAGGDATNAINVNNLDPSEEMKMAGLDFVNCPFCSSAAINEFNTLIICQNSACAKEACNLCKKISHLPWPCEEIFDTNVVNTAESAHKKLKWWKRTVLPSRSVEPENQDDTEFRLVESQFLRMCRQHNVRPPTMRRQPRGTTATATARTAGMVRGLPPPPALPNMGVYPNFPPYYAMGIGPVPAWAPPTNHPGYVGGLPGGMPSMRPATGKKPAFKKIDQFTINTSCFWGSTTIVQFHEIFLTKIMNKLIYSYYLSKNFVKLHNSEVIFFATTKIS